MSLFPTDEDNARYDGIRKGRKEGWDKALSELETFFQCDGGMIPVKSIQEKIRVMKERETP